MSRYFVVFTCVNIIVSFVYKVIRTILISFYVILSTLSIIFVKLCTHLLASKICVSLVKVMLFFYGVLDIHSKHTTGLKTPACGTLFLLRLCDHLTILF